MRRPFLALLLLGIVTEKTMGQDCSASTVNQCLVELGSSGFDLSHVTDDVPTWNDNNRTLRMRCRIYNRLSKCMETVTPYCNISQQMFFQGLSDAANFLCTDTNMNGYLNSQYCYQDPVVQQRASEYSRTYGSKIKINPNQLCKYIDNYIDSLVSMINSECTADDAQWEESWLKAQYSAQMSDFYCPGWITTVAPQPEDSTGATVWVTVLAIVLILTVIILIAGIVSMILVIIRKRKERLRLQRCSRDQTGTSDISSLPPAYNTVCYSSAAPGCEGTTAVEDITKSTFVKPPPYDDQPAPTYDNFTGSIFGNAPVQPSGECGDTTVAPSGEGVVNIGFVEENHAHARPTEANREIEDVRYQGLGASAAADAVVVNLDAKDVNTESRS